jgi:prepilin-type N-terminal cleavage/methylation domain-containing protein
MLNPFTRRFRNLIHLTIIAFFMKLHKRLKGFTLIELLIVIALIAILAGAIIIALNPARQFALSRNSQRWSHVNAILNLVHQNIVENQGTWTCAVGVLPSTNTLMASSGGYDICDCLVPTYTAALPYDPSAAGASYTDCSSYDTQYEISQATSTGRVTVSAPDAELSASISVTQ